MNTTQAKDADGEVVSISSVSTIGDILVAFGYCSREAVEETFALQQREREAGRSLLIGELLVGRGVCTSEQRDFARQVQMALRREKL
ncbi:MAG: hypothetical protein BWY75_02447 [bacterium ADurb.Bin425]|nr:MAG: hypothetical protein BWY75_02447 [bacterium ADurb.Bin425]